MNTHRHHIAQVNVAKCRDELSSERMSSFVARLDEINRLAELSPGFLWRWIPDETDDSARTVFGDPTLIINMSLWSDLDSLKDYVYRSAHLELIRDKKRWFHHLHKPHMALWWLPEGVMPTAQQAQEKLTSLRELGPTQDAFTFASAFVSPGVIDG